MKKINSCAFYKIGFFGLAIVLIGILGYIVSSASTNMSYKNRASVNILNEFTSPDAPNGTEQNGNAGVGKGDPNNGIMPVASISAFTKVIADVADKKYSVSIVEIPSFPVGGIEKNNNISMQFESAAPSGTPEPTATPAKLDCLFVYDASNAGQLQKLVSVPKKTGANNNGTTVSPDYNTKSEPLKLENLLAPANADYFKKHTFMISYVFDTSPDGTTKNPKTCTLTNITMRLDKPPMPSPTPKK